MILTKLYSLHPKILDLIILKFYAKIATTLVFNALLSSSTTPFPFFSKVILIFWASFGYQRGYELWHVSSPKRQLTHHHIKKFKWKPFRHYCILDDKLLHRYLLCLTNSLSVFAQSKNRIHIFCSFNVLGKKNTWKYICMQKMNQLRAALDASTYDDMMSCHHEIVHNLEAFHHERLFVSWWGEQLTSFGLFLKLLCLQTDKSPQLFIMHLHGKVMQEGRDKIERMRDIRDFACMS